MVGPFGMVVETMRLFKDMVVETAGTAFATGKDNCPKSSNDGYDVYGSGYKYDASTNYGWDAYNARLNPDVVEARKKKP
jgi:hypothetical protein